MTMTKEEADGIDVVDSAFLRPEGERLAGSYINFYIANGAIILPQFEDKHDAEARRKLAELFPQREVVGISAREILAGWRQHPLHNAAAASRPLNARGSRQHVRVCHGGSRIRR